MKTKLFICLNILFLGIAENTSCQNIPAYVPANGLVGWWPFTGNAKDSSGLGHHGTTYGPILTTDRYGTLDAAYYFDGINDRIEVTDQPNLRCRKITISVWILPNPFLPGLQIVYKADLSTANNEAYSVNSSHAAIKDSSNSMPGVGWRICSFIQPASSTSWSHLLFTYDGDSLTTYINGIKKNQISHHGLIDSCAIGNLRFGFNHLSSGNGDPFHGKIDDIGIWNRALSLQEITNLYNGGNVGLEQINNTNEMLLFPNPFFNELIISTGASLPSQLIIYDLASRIILHQSFANTVTVNTSHISNGIYFYEVKAGNGKTQSGKIVKY